MRKKKSSLLNYIFFYDHIVKLDKKFAMQKSWYDGRGEASKWVVFILGVAPGTPNSLILRDLVRSDKESV